MSKNEQSEMSFWDHLDVLRSLIFKMLILVVAMMCLFFVLMPDIFDSVILAPCRGDFPLYTLFGRITQQFPSLPQFDAEGWEVKLINIQLASQFFIHMSTSFWLGLIFSFPAVLYLMWKFVKPALYARERLGVKLAFSLGVLMFDMGLAVGYFVVFPVTLRFLADYQVSAMIPNQISLDSYMDTFLMLLFVMGLVFEMPLVAWVLSKIGLLTRGFFRRYRRHAVVVLLILAAVITPTGDPFTLMIVFIPLYLLYELSALIVKPAPPVDDEGETSEA